MQTMKHTVKPQNTFPKKPEPLHIPWPKGLSLHNFVGCYEVMNSALENSQQNSFTLPFSFSWRWLWPSKEQVFFGDWTGDIVRIKSTTAVLFSHSKLRLVAEYEKYKFPFFNFYFSSELLVRPNVWVIIVKTRTVEQLIIQLKCFQGFEYFVGNDH